MLTHLMKPLNWKQGSIRGEHRERERKGEMGDAERVHASETCTSLMSTVQLLFHLCFIECVVGKHFIDYTCNQENIRSRESI